MNEYMASDLANQPSKEPAEKIHFGDTALGQGLAAAAIILAILSPIIALFLSI